MKHALLTLSLLPLGAVHAQNQGTTSIPTSEYTLDLGALPGDVTHTDWGDFDGDGQEDFVLQYNGMLSIFFAPGIYEALVSDVSLAVQNNNVVRDFAVLRRGTEANQPYGRDRIVVIDDDGLVELFFGSTSQAFSCTRIVHGGFADARLLDSWSKADGSKHWLVASDSTGTNIYLGELAGTQPLVTSTVTTNSPPVTDVVLFDWDGLGEPEAAFSTGTSLAILDPWGTDTEIVAYDPAVTYLDIARTRRGDAGAAAEGLATLVTVGAGTYLATWQGSAGTPVLLPAEHEFYGMTAGRWDAGDRDDLVLAGNGTESVFILPDQGSGATAVYAFDSTTVEAGYLGVNGVSAGDAADQVGEPRLLDVDHDGDFDLLYALQNAGRMWVHRNAEYDEGLDSVVIDPQAYGSAGSVPNYGGEFNRDTGFMYFTLILPASLPSLYLDVVAWGQQGTSGVVAPETISNERITITPADISLGAVEVALDLTEFTEDLEDPGFFSWEKGLFAIFQFVDAPGPSAMVLPNHAYNAVGAKLVPYTGSGWTHEGGWNYHISASGGPPPDPGGGGTSTGGSGGGANCIPATQTPQRP